MLSFDAYQQFITTQREAGGHRFVLPVYKRLSADLLTPVSAFLMLREQGRYAFLLESVEGGEKLARYSFLGKNPYRVVKAYGADVTIEEGRANKTVATNGQAPSGDIFEVLNDLMQRYEEVKLPGLPRFASGAVGYLGYDAVRLVEHLPNQPEADVPVPDAIWCFYDTVVAFDRVKHQLVLMASTFLDETTDLEAAYADATRRIAALERELATGTMVRPEPVRLLGEDLQSNMTQEAFEAAVEKGRQYIYEGDIFQVVLSQRFAMQFTGDRFNLYRALRQVNPSPYLFFLDFEDCTLVGSSPEVLVRVEEGKVEVLPIAGTRKRGGTPEEDAALEADLLADPKERAEHLMLVDLGRNDVGRVSQYGTVQVERYAFIERYSHVMHIVSAVSGRLATQQGAMDVLAACFPAGTLSGAPKVRAMEIIDELEPTKRGVYGGAVGYLDYSGNMDTCIAIRTMVVQGDTIYIQAGAGIVADSDPTFEYEETKSKAGALQQAIRMAAGGLL